MATDSLSEHREFLAFVTKTPIVAGGGDGLDAAEARMAVCWSRFEVAASRLSAGDRDAIGKALDAAESLLTSEKTLKEGTAALDTAESLLDRASGTKTPSSAGSSASAGPQLASELKALRSAAFEEAAQVSAAAINLINRAERLGDRGLLIIAKARATRKDLLNALQIIKSAGTPDLIARGRKVVDSCRARNAQAQVLLDKAGGA